MFQNIWRSINRSGGRDMSDAIKTLTIEQGYDKEAFNNFMQYGATLASKPGKIREGQEAASFNVRFQTRVRNKSDLERERAGGTNRLTTDVTKDQMKGFMEAFQKRQTEVWGRRSRPGISQTRLV